MPSPFSSSIVPVGWSRMLAARWITVSTPRIAWRIENGSREVAERDLDVDPVRAEPPRVAHEHAHVLPGSSSIGSSSPPTSPVAPVSRITRH